MCQRFYDGIRKQHHLADINFFFKENSVKYWTVKSPNEHISFNSINSRSFLFLLLLLCHPLKFIFLLWMHINSSSSSKIWSEFLSCSFSMHCSTLFSILILHSLKRKRIFCHAIHNPGNIKTANSLKSMLTLSVLMTWKW